MKMKLHITVDKARREELEPKMLRLMPDLNISRYRKFGVASGTIEGQMMPALQADPDFKSVDVDSEKSAS